MFGFCRFVNYLTPCRNWIPLLTTYVQYVKYFNYRVENPHACGEMATGLSRKDHFIICIHAWRCLRDDYRSLNLQLKLQATFKSLMLLPMLDRP